MDFLDPKKKRAHAVRLYVGYVLVTIAVLLATVLLLYAALGYGIDRTTGQVIQNGLIFVDVHPEQANITISGQDKGQTSGRFVFQAGNYSVELSRDGYRTWRKDVIVGGGSIVRLVYPFLFPSQLVTSTIAPTTTTPDVVSASPDRHWVLMHTPDAFTTFQSVDTSTKLNVASPFTVPATLFGTHTGSQKLELVEWSTDNKHMLLKYDYTGGYDYIVIDRDKPDESVNVSQVMGHAYTSVTLHNKQPDKLYGYDAAGGVLQAVDLKAKTQSVVESNVISFWPYKDTDLLYTTSQGAPAGQVLARLHDGQSDYTVRTLNAGSKYLLNIAEFNSDMYVVAASSTDGRLYVYKNPLTTLKKNDPNATIPLLLLRLDNPDAVSFSDNARFIALQAGSKFQIYDAETTQQYRYDTKLALDPGQKATWMDGHRLMLVSGGKLNIFDFDGINMQTLVAASPGFTPLFDRDYTAMFTYGPQASDATKTGLSRTELIAKKTQ